jgi:hypothetical protein
MRYARLAMVGLFVFALAGTAHANSINDPGAILKGGGGSFGIVGLSFTIFAPTGAGTFAFDNLNNFALTSLQLTFTPGGPSGTATFSCAIQPGSSGVPAFTTCQYTHIGGPTSPTVLEFFGGAGIKPHVEFSIQLFGWPVNLTAQGLANVPEPATMSLLLLGMGATFLRRKRISA